VTAVTGWPAKTDPSKEVSKAAAEIVAMYPETYFDKNNERR
jgi:hypothetical protein